MTLKALAHVVAKCLKFFIIYENQNMDPNISCPHAKIK